MKGLLKHPSLWLMVGAGLAAGVVLLVGVCYSPQDGGAGSLVTIRYTWVRTVQRGGYRCLRLEAKATGQFSGRPGAGASR